MITSSEQQIGPMNERMRTSSPIIKDNLPNWASITTILTQYWRANDYKHNVNLTGIGKITNMHFHKKVIRGEVPRITKLRGLTH